MHAPCYGKDEIGIDMPACMCVYACICYGNKNFHTLLPLIRVTRLFCGNLNKNITAEELQERLPGITYIKWITDKQTGEFYGSSFLEMKDAAAAAFAVQQDRTKFLGRWVMERMR